MNIKYEIEKETNAVKVFYDESTVPSLYQPHYPDGTPWADVDDATAWAELYVASVVDESAPYAPNSPGIPGEPKPTPEQIAEWEAARAARQ